MKALEASLWVRGVLVTGICLSLPCLLAGMIRLMLQPQPSDQSLTMAAYWQSFLHGESLGLLFVGLTILAVSPLVGVLAAAIGFFVQRERRYTLIALVILLMTLATFVLRAR